MNDDELKSLLDGSRTVAIVGLSTEILGRPAYATLADIPVPVDIVNVFRPAAEAEGIAQQAVAIGSKTLWPQLGIASDEARGVAEAAGLHYVEDRCIGETTKRLGNRARA